jgi:hypothetical protein
MAQAMIVKEFTVADSGADDRGVSLRERKHMKTDPPMEQGPRLKYG